MLADHFQDRVARVVAALRLVLALIFLVAIYAEPSQPVRAPLVGYSLLLAYALLAAVLLRVAWVDWWQDYRLATPAFLIDATVFSFSVWLTESGDGGFNSPFMAFFFFLMFSASLRWNWRATAIAALITVSAYLLAGGVLIVAGTILDMQVFVRRLTYMSVIAAAFVISAIQSRSERRDGQMLDLGEFDALEAAVRHTAGRLRAGRVALVWEDRDEPPILCTWDDGRVESRAADLVDKGDAGMVRLFDLRKGRTLSKAGEGMRMTPESCDSCEAAARLAGIEQGLCAGLGTERGGRGLLIAGAMPSLAVDDLDRFRDLAGDVVSIIAQRTLADLQRDRAVVQTREALARDLHDSVAQALAGASFGLEAIRQTIPPTAAEPLRLTRELKSTLRREQAHIREMIDRLRVAPTDSHIVEIGPELARTAQECALRWDVKIDVESHGGQRVPAPLAFECKQIVREAVANAVRHGKAGRVTINVAARSGGLVLVVENDGAPFGTDPHQSQPWTISERVGWLGGEIDVSKCGKEARLRIELPLGPGVME